MDRRTLTASMVAVAMGIGGAAQAGPVMSQTAVANVKPANILKAKAQRLVPCYGIAAKGKNDCSAGVHSCSGEATVDRDPQSFVLLPVGDCEKIAGGSLEAH